MKQFKAKLKLNIIFDAIFCTVMLVLACVTFDPTVGVSLGGGFHSWGAFTSGLCAGLLVVYGIDLIRGIRALRSEEKLKKMFVKENDERTSKIWSSARSAASRMTLGLGVSACVVAGYFSMAVAWTIVACLVAHSALVMLMVLIYSKKY